MTDKQNQAMTAGELIEDIHKFLSTGNAAKAIEVERSARELLQDALPILESTQAKLAASEACLESIIREKRLHGQVVDGIVEARKLLYGGDMLSPEEMAQSLDKEET